MGFNLGGGGLSSIINPADTVINKVTGNDNASNYLDPMSLTSSGTKRVVKWLGKEAVMPVTEAKWWVDTLQGNNGNSLGSMFASHDAMHASSTKELNNDNWFANHPDEAAAMVWSAGLASGAFGGGAAAGAGAADGASTAEGAGAGGGVADAGDIASGSTVGSGVGDTSGVVAGTDTGSLTSGDMALAPGEDGATVDGAGASANGTGQSSSSSDFFQNQLKSTAKSYAVNQMMKAMSPSSRAGGGGYGAFGAPNSSIGMAQPGIGQIQSPNIMPIFSTAAQNQPGYTAEYSNSQNVNKLAQALMKGSSNGNGQPY